MADDYTELGTTGLRRVGGFVIDDRHVVTNQHVAGPDVHPLVELRDGRQIESTLIGFDTAYTGSGTNTVVDCEEQFVS